MSGVMLAYRRTDRVKVFRLHYPHDALAEPFGPWIMAHRCGACHAYEYHEDFAAAVADAASHRCKVGVS